MKKLFFILLIIPTLLAFETDWQEGPHSRVRVIGEYDSALKGQDFQLALEFELEDEWHIYWENPGNFGMPLSLSADLAKNWKLKAIDYPLPKLKRSDNFISFIYEHHVLLPFNIFISENSQVSRQKLDLDLTYLICREACIPSDHSFSLSLTILKNDKQPQASRAHQKKFSDLRKSLPVRFDDETDESIHLDYSFKEDFLEVELSLTEERYDHSFSLFPQTELVLDLEQDFELTPDPQSRTLTAQLSYDSLYSLKTFKKNNSSLEILLVSDQVLYPGTDVKAWKTRLTAKNDAVLAGGAVKVFYYLALALLGGILLNLMPCVFPVLSIKLFHLIETSQKENSIKKLKQHGNSYSLGVILSFFTFGLILFLLRSGGHLLGWGFQLQSPVFVAALCLLFVALSLSFLGWYELGLSFSTKQGGLFSRVQARSRDSGFFSGVLITIVSTPCTAPFMGASLGFALTQSAWLALLIFTFLGIGMALPYWLLCFIPSWSRILPKPGAWMESLKQFMAFPLLATGLWLIWVLEKQGGFQSVLYLLASSLLLAFSLWLYGNTLRSSQKRSVKIFSYFIVVAGVIAALSLLWPIKQGQMPSTNTVRTDSKTDAYGLTWQSFDKKKIIENLEQGHSVFINFTAAWCLSCQVNKRVTFSSEKVQDFIHSSENLILYEADWTSRDADIGAELQLFDRVGVPLYLYIPTGSAYNKALILPEVLTPGVFLNYLERDTIFLGEK